MQDSTKSGTADDLRRWAVVRGAIGKPLAFAARELALGGIGTYRVRGSKRKVVIRQRTSDAQVFREIFNEGEYDRFLLDSEGPHAPPMVDLEAHVGLFHMRASVAYPDATLIALEPDARNLEVLRRWAALNDPLGRWRIVRGCGECGLNDKIRPRRLMGLPA
jgi:hypothetical protein